ncbi:hypothetical protein [Haloimpatiens lingqiaonensis]|uniref:hypothetical protein n=1 Tax=Haloimpatiens lingqiaonensis TaxID=1380675 RepID=UPI0010FF243C|nr:hypothetical protein [Haloimpatiens lingqiaonensis]
MPSADSMKYCPLLKRKICRAYCMEIGDVRNDDMDMEHIEDKFDSNQKKFFAPLQPFSGSTPGVVT